MCSPVGIQELIDILPICMFQIVDHVDPSMGIMRLTVMQLMKSNSYFVGQVVGH